MKLMKLLYIIGQIQKRKSATGHDGKRSSDDHLTESRRNMHINYNEKFKAVHVKEQT
jgi:hypothetical protein